MHCRQSSTTRGCKTCPTKTYTSLEPVHDHVHSAATADLRPFFVAGACAPLMRGCAKSVSYVELLRAQPHSLPVPRKAKRSTTELGR